MKLKFLLIIFSYIFSVTTMAADRPLVVGVESFAPPFVVLGAGQRIYGFDADMMQALCTKMNRECVYEPMLFKDLINAASTGATDMSLSAIAITLDRAKLVNFSLPYLNITHRFLTKKANAQKPFTALNNARIGYEQGTILDTRVSELNISNPKLIPYKHIEDEILALNEGKLDFVILDNPTALYWEVQSSGELATFGEPIPSSYSLGIAVNPNDPALLTALNQALKIYLRDGSYKVNYDRYLKDKIM